MIREYAREMALETINDARLSVKSEEWQEKRNVQLPRNRGTDVVDRSARSLEA